MYIQQIINHWNNYCFKIDQFCAISMSSLLMIFDHFSGKNKYFEAFNKIYLCLVCVFLGQLIEFESIYRAIMFV